MSLPILPSSAPGPVPGAMTPRNQALYDAARQLESTFLSEMLKSAGLGEARESFGGGAGEEHFGSFLRTAQADTMVAGGGIGLAEHLFEALKVRAGAE